MPADEEREGAWAVLSHTAGLFPLRQPTRAGFAPLSSLGRQPEMAFSPASV